MAFTLSTIYNAVDKFSGPLKAMQAANQKFAAAQSKSFKALGNTFTNMKNQLLSLAGGLSIASLVGIGANAIINYDSALASLSSITGVTGKQFESFKKEVISVATNTKKSAVDVAKAFELVGSAKPELLKDAKALGQVSQAAIILSKASRDDLATSATNLTGVLNQFNLGAEQSNRAINVLAAGSLVGAANISRINEAMVNVGAVASGANLSLEQTVAALEVLGSKQLFGAEAGTKLRGVILKLQQAGLGYKSGQFQINDALAEANTKISQLSNAKAKDALITKIFGMENITAGKIMLGNIPMFNEMTKGVTGTSIAQQQAATNSASFAVKLQGLKTRFENIVISGNETSGALNAFGKILEWVTTNLGTIITVVGVLTTAYAAYYTIMTLTAFVTKIVTIAQIGLNTAIKNNPIGWIITGIMILITVITLLVQNWDAVKTAMGKFFSAAWNGIRKFAGYILDYMLWPIILVLKAIAKLTGAQWANDALEKYQQIRDKITGDNQEKAQEIVKPVNTLKASNDAQTSRYEEINKQQLQIMLENKTDKQVNISKNPALIPVTTNTY